MSKYYPKLLQPMKIGNSVYKTRLICLPCKPPFLQGSEDYPTEAVIKHYANKAKNGAASMVIFGARCPYSEKIPHCTGWDIYNDHAQQLISQLTDAIHYYDSKCTMFINPLVPDGYDVSDGIPSIAAEGDGSVAVCGKAMTEEILQEVADDFCNQCLALKECGFDGVYMHMAYEVTAMGRFLSTRTNTRTDQYGGSFENRIRWPLYLCRLVKQRCGKDYLIECSISGEIDGGWTRDEAAEFVRQAADCIDIIHIRSSNIDQQSNLGFDPNPYPQLEVAEYIKKKSGGVIPIAVTGGFWNLDDMEKILEEGRVDMIGAARLFISNTDLAEKLATGRSDDVVPCIKCNKCHKSNMSDPWSNYCSVNPVWGNEHRVEGMITTPDRVKKVAVIGGGPAGINSALILAKRGHEVTLFEKDTRLGGQLNPAVVPYFKWPLKQFFDYLVRQLEKSNVKVVMGTEVNAEVLKSYHFDTIVCAIGSDPTCPPVPGLAEHSMNARYALEHADEVGQKVVIIGGGEIGAEAGMYYAEHGRDVLVVEMLDQIAKDAVPVHYRSEFHRAWEKLPGFRFVVNAKCSKATENSVSYIDENGVEQTVAADTIIVAAGAKSKHDEALALYSCADEFYMVGDCRKAGNVQKLMANTFATCNQI